MTKIKPVKAISFNKTKLILLDTETINEMGTILTHKQNPHALR